MNQNSDQNEGLSDSNSRLRDNMIDALLQSAYQTDSEREHECIANVLHRIEPVLAEPQQLSSETVEATGASTSNASSSSTNERPARRTSRQWSRWMSWAIAASVLVMIGIATQFIGNPGSAMAAVERSLAAAKELVSRHYRITITNERASGIRTITSDLYVQGADHFALRHPALIPGANVWLGSDGAESWFVPSIGPVRVGDETGLGKWLSSREQFLTPILHVETVLTRLKRAYHLTSKPDATLTLGDGAEVICQHVVGERKPQVTSSAPNQIELWCDKQTGVAIRLDATTENPTKRLTRRHASILFVDSPELSDDWFTPEGHHRGFRRKLRFDSDE